jgi:hypothetical protein
MEGEDKHDLYPCNTGNYLPHHSLLTYNTVFLVEDGGSMLLWNVMPINYTFW